tara:strand:+ start:145 stop:612 length:468 start_codon:yes stop_codon:yes gene_type:complete
VKPSKEKNSLSLLDNTLCCIPPLMSSFHHDLAKYFEGFPIISPFPSVISTTCDIIDEGDHLTINIDLPGISKDDIEIHTTEHSLEISANHSQDSKIDKKNYLKKERTNFSYYRIIDLPVPVKNNKISAKLSDGVLTITLPKITPKSEKKQRVQVE